MSLPNEIKTTPLYKEHNKLHAQMAPFAGWHMPIQYEGIIAEYEQCRSKASLFDICHMGEFIFEGDCLKSGFDNIVTCRISDMKLKTCRYGFMLNNEGGVVDDLVIFRISDEKWMIVVNAATIEKDFEQITSNLTKEARLTDMSTKIGKLDIQGPLSRDVLKKHVSGIESLKYYTFDYFDLLGENTIVSRTGYTGELGYEIYFPTEKISELWCELLKDSNAKPAGLGARDVLRMEMGYSLYGQDLDDTISPIEAGLDKFVDFEKDFIGRNALIKTRNYENRRKSICFVSDTRRSPRHNQGIYAQDSKEIGTVTSGTFSPHLKTGIGIGLILEADTAREEKIYFGNDKNKNSATIINRPFYKKGSLKS